MMANQQCTSTRMTEGVFVIPQIQNIFNQCFMERKHGIEIMLHERPKIRYYAYADPWKLLNNAIKMIVKLHEIGKVIYVLNESPRKILSVQRRYLSN